MPLIWNLEEINDYKKLCWEETKEKGEDGENLFKLKPKTEVLTWFSLIGGLPNITKKNWKEFYIRISLWEKTNGAFCALVDEDGNRVEDPFTMEDIYSHIGFSTNSGTLSKTEFLSKLYKSYGDATNHQVKKFLSKLDEDKKN